MKKINSNNKKQFNKIESILTMLVIFVAIITYFITYKVSFKDPIAEVKNTFIKSEIIAITITILITGLVMILIKDEKRLMKTLKAIAIFAVSTIIVLIGMKLHLDNTYNKEVFGEFYDRYEAKEDEKSEEEYRIDEYKVDFSLSGINLVTPKEAYIKESTTGYTYFSIKVGIYITAELIITIIILYLYFRLVLKEGKQKEIRKNDKYLFNKK